MGPLAAMAGATVVSGLLGARAAGKQASAMNAQAAAQVEAARIAAEEARFRPVGITTRFGTATPQFTGGRLTGYDYQGSPEVLALQDQLSRIYGPSLTQAERAATYQPQFQQAAEQLFALGQAEIPQSREQIMQQQRDLLRPYDIEEEQRLAAGVFGRGRGGLSVGTGGQPELQALAEARRRRDLQLAANVDQQYMSRAQQAAGLMGAGAGLLGTGYEAQTAALGPFQGAFQSALDLETAAQQPLQIGSALGSKVTAANTNAGNIMLSGQTAAGNLQRQAATARAQQLAGAAQGVGNLATMYGMGMFTPGSTPTAAQGPAQVVAGSGGNVPWQNYWQQ